MGTLEIAAILRGIQSEIENSFANNSPLYASFESTASLETITEFLHWDAAQPAYSQYLNRWLPKAPQCMAPALREHHFLEVSERHSEHFQEMLQHLDGLVSVNPDLDWEVLNPLNYTFCEDAVTERDIGFFLGGFLATETMSAKRCRQLYIGLRRLGIVEKPLTYLKIHFEADENHAAEVVEEMIHPLLKFAPEYIASIVDGARDRLQRSGDFLQWYGSQEIHQIMHCETGERRTCA